MMKPTNLERDFDWQTWMSTTCAGARAVDSYRLVHLELSRRFDLPIADIEFLWCINLLHCLAEPEAEALTSDALVQVNGHRSELARNMSRAMMNAIGHPNSSHLDIYVGTDGRRRGTGMKVEFLIGSEEVNQAAEGSMNAHISQDLLERRGADAKRLRVLEPNEVLGWVP